MASFFSNSARAAAAASSSKAKAEPVVAARSQPWVEKYRPKTLEEVRSQDHATLVLRRLVNASNLPHLLYVCLAGTEGVISNENAGYMAHQVPGRRAPF